MIVRYVKGDIFKSPYQHIVFGVNAEGGHNAGFAGDVARRFWPELPTIGKKKLGTILEKTAGGRTFHALVCHQLRDDGWAQTPQLVEKCLNELKVDPAEEIAIVLIGSGFAGYLFRADVQAIMQAMERSNKKLIIYSI
jgi:O-acetyl-ADP-ribose deacetylase (regulator of RNase III)